VERKQQTQLCNTFQQYGGQRLSPLVYFTALLRYWLVPFTTSNIGKIRVRALSPPVYNQAVPIVVDVYSKRQLVVFVGRILILYAGVCGDPVYFPSFATII